MSFLDHLEELRFTLFYSVGSFVVSAVLVIIFITFFADFLKWPLNMAYGTDSETMVGLTTRAPFEVFSVLIQIVFLGALALSLPLILYFVARFVAPGLNEREIKILAPGCAAAFGLFLVGASFAFFGLMPVALKAVRVFHETLDLQMLWSPAKYYETVTLMTVGVGLIFEFPLVLLLLIYLGIVPTWRLRKSRAYAVVGFLVAAAVITPTGDPVTFLLLAVPLYTLYELSILAGTRLERKKAEMEAESGWS